KSEIEQIHKERQIWIYKQQELTSLHLEQSLKKKQLLHVKEQLLAQIETLKKDIFPLETTLKMQELMQAKLICNKHVEQTQNNECPVCQTPQTSHHWESLATKIQQADMESIKSKYQSLTHDII